MSRFTFQECVQIQQHLRHSMIVEGNAPAYSRYLMNRLFVDLARRHANDYPQPMVRLGDFEGRNTHGSMHDVKCRKCGLSGAISLPMDDYAIRTKCPRCHHIPETEWQRVGQAGLLPPEQLKPATRQIATVNGIDDEMPYVKPSEDDNGVELLSDDPRELSVEEIVANADAAVIENELEGVTSEEEPSAEEKAEDDEDEAEDE